MKVSVLETSASSLTHRDWEAIQLARRSYASMWGTNILDKDSFDALGASVYNTHHYISSICDGDGPCKILTMRKVLIDTSQLTRLQIEHPFKLLPLDIQFWMVDMDDGAGVPLWEVLKAHARRMAPQDPLAEFRIASLSRTGAFPFGEPNKAPRHRERTAIGFAAIQLLAADEEADLLYVSQLCPEFRDKVLGLRMSDGAYIAPEFTTTEELLGLPRGSIRMDNRLATVRRHKAAGPGYLIDNESAAELILHLVESGRLTIADLRPTISRLVEQETVLGRAREELVELVCAAVAGNHRHVAGALTSPAMFKYMAPRIMSNEPLTRMSGAEFRRLLIDSTKDGPFSSAVHPRNWFARARDILAAAEEKYG